MDVRFVPDNTPIWAWACKLKLAKNDFLLHQKPIQGELFKNGFKRYFAPYKNGTHDLNKAKAVLDRNREYVATYEECVRAYNYQLTNIQKYFQTRINELEKEKIKEE